MILIDDKVRGPSELAAGPASVIVLSEVENTFLAREAGKAVLRVRGTTVSGSWVGEGDRSRVNVEVEGRTDVLARSAL